MAARVVRGDTLGVGGRRVEGRVLSKKERRVEFREVTKAGLDVVQITSLAFASLAALFHVTAATVAYERPPRDC